MELLHIDLFGPIKTSFVNGKKYGLVIVDDISRWTWVKFLKNKDESYYVFTTFWTHVQNKKNLKFVKVRINHGGEFENKYLENIFENNGISPIPELLIIMESLNEKIVLYKKWP